MNKFYTPFKDFRWILVAFLIIFLQSSGQSVCSLTDLTVIKTPCSNNGTFTVKINFNYKETSDCFKVSGNGKDYGTFMYTKLPIIIDGLKGDCTTPYEFVITDCLDNQCTIAKELGIVCCEPKCLITELKIEKLECDSNGLFHTLLNFKHDNTSDCFNVFVNGQLLKSYFYRELPVKLGPFEGDCQTVRNFKVQDCNLKDCFGQIEMDKVCCNESCNFSDIRIEKGKCDSLNRYFAFVGFKASGVTDSFYIKANDKTFGKFAYGKSSYPIGPFEADCRTKLKILIFDAEKTHCAEDTLWGPVCCDSSQLDCKLFNLRFEKTDCDAREQFFVKINFDYLNTSDCFTVTGNGKNYGTFKYSNLPLSLGPLHGDCKTEYEFVIRDCHNELCKIENSIGKVCCDSVPEPCKIYDFTYDVSDCDENDLFNLHINFRYQNTSECFRLKVNGVNYGEFKYSQLPIVLDSLHGDCITDYKIFIQDCTKPDCSFEKSIGKICCDVNPEPCKLYNFRFETSKCDDNDYFKLHINFNYQNTSECFKLKLNGQLYGEYRYASLPLQIDSLLGDCKTEYKISIVDCKDSRCSIESLIGKVCCDSIAGCRLTDLLLEKTECNADNLFYVYLKVKGDNTSECFKVTGNGREYGEFKYTHVPIKLGPFHGDCKTNYEFVVSDCRDLHCRIEKNLGVVCCEKDCKLSGLKIERTPCTADKMFYAVLNFSYSETSDCFKVFGNGRYYGDFKYANLPIKIGPLLADCNTPYEFVVQDCHNERCKIDADLGKVCCDSIDNIFYDFELARTDCDRDSMFNIKFSFKYRDVSDSFSFYIDGMFNGIYAYSQMPITAGPLKADCHSIYKFTIVDQKDTLKKIYRYLERPCCKPNSAPCVISEIKATPISCTGPGMYSLQINFRYSGISNRFFDVYDRNGLIGYFDFNALPITILDFKKTGKDFDYIKICENDNPSCCKVAEFRSIQCLTNNPAKFDIKKVLINQTNRTLSLFSPVEFPMNLELEFFNLQGKSLELHNIERGLFEISIDMDDLADNIYFVRLKSNDDSKTYKFFKFK